MSRNGRQFGFTLLEVVVVIATIMILAGALLGVGKYLTIRASVQLCKSQIEVICTALEQYYDDHGVFPFTTDTGVDTYPADGVDDYLRVANLQADLNGEVQKYNLSNGTLASLAADELVDTDVNGDEIPYSANVAIYYFLGQSSNSRKIIDALSGELITNKYDTDNAIVLVPNDGSDNIDLPRFVDPWGLSLRYEYADGAAFPVLTSAGPDGDFTTTDDNISSQ